MALQERTLQVGISKGILAGQQIRLSGQGSPGFADGARGDLYLEVEFAPHANWRVDGSDVDFTLRVAPWEAVMGATVDVPTPDGTVDQCSVDRRSPPSHSPHRPIWSVETAP